MSVARRPRLALQLLQAQHARERQVVLLDADAARAAERARQLGEAVGGGVVGDASSAAGAPAGASSSSCGHDAARRRRPRRTTTANSRSIASGSKPVR